jgi:hypothetical protein
MSLFGFGWKTKSNIKTGYDAIRAEQTIEGPLNFPEQILKRLKSCRNLGEKEHMVQLSFACRPTTSVTSISPETLPNILQELTNDAKIYSSFVDPLDALNHSEVREKLEITTDIQLWVLKAFVRMQANDQFIKGTEPNYYDEEGNIQTAKTYAVKYNLSLPATAILYIWLCFQGDADHDENRLQVIEDVWFNTYANEDARFQLLTTLSSNYRTRRYGKCILSTGFSSY